MKRLLVILILLVAASDTADWYRYQAAPIVVVEDGMIWVNDCGLMEGQ